MFDALYDTKNMSDALNDNWCGPDKLPHAEEVRIAIFDKEDGGDGHKVELYCTAMPAKFFTIKALETRNSAGELRQGFKLNTGSGCFEWSIKTAEMLTEGTLGVDG